MAKEAEAEAVFLVAKVEVERAELTLSWTRVTAPFSGRVSRIQATEGTLVTADQTPIVRVVATDPLHVTFNVPEAILLQLSRDGLSEPGKLGVAVGFAIDEGYPHAAKLDLIDRRSIRRRGPCGSGPRYRIRRGISCPGCPPASASLLHPKKESDPTCGPLFAVSDLQLIDRRMRSGSRPPPVLETVL